MVQQPLLGEGILIVEASLWHKVRHITVGMTPLDE